MRPPRTAVWFAVAGFLLAVLFVAFGDVSSEPSDHPRWVMAGFKAGPRLVVIPYVILMGFCLPGFFVNYVLMDVTLELLGYPGLGGRPGSALNYLTYPLLQGLLYGGVVWALISMGRAVRRTILHRNTSSGVASPGSSPGAWPSQGNRWRLLGIVAILVISYSVLSLYLLFPDVPPSWTADYDEERYTQIHGAIAADPKRLVGKSLDEVTKALSLADVPWDDSTFQRVSGMDRIYHFRGFALHVTLQLLPPGITPDSQAWTVDSMRELQLHGVLWLDQRPFVRIDGISDGKERMKRFWKAIDDACERINAEMDQRRQQSRK